MASQLSRASILFLMALALLLALVGAPRPSSGASISYGDFGPVAPGIQFLGVVESSGTDPVPLYGAPAPVPVGLDFDPMGFVATAAGGGVDLTDGQLNLTLLAGPSLGITAISLLEAGDYTLGGTGTSVSEVLAGAILRASVTGINGLDVAPIDLVPVNASVGFALNTNAGVVQPWSLGLALDVAAQLGPDERATRIELSIDDALMAVSELSSLAFIAKKEFRLEVDGLGVDIVVPEPTSALLLLLGAAALWPLNALRPG